MDTLNRRGEALVMRAQMHLIYLRACPTMLFYSAIIVFHSPMQSSDGRRTTLDKLKLGNRSSLVRILYANILTMPVLRLFA